MAIKNGHEQKAEKSRIENLIEKNDHWGEIFQILLKIFKKLADLKNNFENL